MSDYAHLDNKLKNIRKSLQINTEQINFLSSNVNHLSSTDRSSDDQSIIELNSWRNNVNSLLNGVIPGEVSESKILVSDENRDMVGFNNLQCDQLTIGTSVFTPGAGGPQGPAGPAGPAGLSLIHISEPTRQEARS